MDRTLLDGLRSQRDLMRKSAQGEAHIVYGYLRAKDSGTAKAGTPYYIGIGNSHIRPFQPHARGGRVSKLHNVPVPKNEALVRQFGVFPGREGAIKREQDLIARYGRKGLDDGGILLNRTAGGEGVLGFKPTAQQRERNRIAQKNSEANAAAREKARIARLAAAAARIGVAPDWWGSLTMAQRGTVLARHRRGTRGPSLMANLGEGYVSPSNQVAEKYGVPVLWWESLSRTRKAAVHARYKRGSRGSDLMQGLEGAPENIDLRLAGTAKRIGLCVKQFAQLTEAQRILVRRRYRDGKRGLSLLAGIIPA